MEKQQSRTKAEEPAKRLCKVKLGQQFVAPVKNRIHWTPRRDKRKKQTSFPVTQGTLEFLSNYNLAESLNNTAESPLPGTTWPPVSPCARIVEL